jgi:hypothetical protein
VDASSAFDDSYSHNSQSSKYLDPEAAFRESLFDALADDEGAAYWEGVYGQPIHTYPRTKPGEKGELEEMTDEEYATYVRNRMWERSHQHILEERERRESAQKKQQEENEQSHKAYSDRKRFDALIDDALRSGDRRRRERAWKDAWDNYFKKWSKLIEATTAGSADGKHASAMIPWPVETGRRKDVTKAAVEGFLRHHPEETLAALVKGERIRWHPDKMQQRFPDGKLDHDILQSITAVFQIIDTLWSNVKNPG